MGITQVSFCLMKSHYFLLFLKTKRFSGHNMPPFFLKNTSLLLLACTSTPTLQPPTVHSMHQTFSTLFIISWIGYFSDPTSYGLICVSAFAPSLTLTRHALLHPATAHRHNYNSASIHSKARMTTSLFWGDGKVAAPAIICEVENVPILEDIPKG